MTIRCFISIELSDAIRRSLAGLIADLRKSGPDVAWVSADKIHLTLKFLGNANTALIPKIKEHIGKKLSHYNAFCIKIVGIGCFPSERRPRVLWIGIEHSEVLSSIQKVIDTELAGFGFAQEERSFAPHLTIGRVRSQKGITGLIVRLPEFRTTYFGTIEVNSIRIVKSQLKPAGAEYTAIAEIPIGTGRN